MDGGACDILLQMMMHYRDNVEKLCGLAHVCLFMFTRYITPRNVRIALDADTFQALQVCASTCMECRQFLCLLNSSESSTFIVPGSNSDGKPD